MRGIAQRFETMSRRTLLLTLLALFLAAHAFYYGLGVRFDAGLMVWQWQFLDPPLLKEHLLQSLLYQHSQPPAFNFLLGLTLKLAPHDYPLVLQSIFLLCGFALYATLVRLMRRLGVARWLAVAVSTVFMISPAFILYEHYLYYTFPLAAVLALSAVVFDRWLQERRTWQAALFFTLIFLQCVTWALFHLLYFFLLVGMMLWLGRGQRRQTLLACALPLLLLVALYAKNAVIFGQFSASSWMGMNLARTTVKWLPTETRGELLTEGKLSHTSLVNPFVALTEYDQMTETAPSPFDRIPALAQPRKSDGSLNFNHYNYIGISRGYLHDSIYVIEHQPKTYLLHGVLPAWLIYFTPATNYDKLRNAPKIAPVLSVYDYGVCGEAPFLNFSDYTPYLFLLIALPLLFVYGTFSGMGGKPLGETLSENQRRLLLYLCFNILYIAVVGNCVERGENNRFRFITDPFSVVIFGLFAQQIGAYWKRERKKNAAK